MIPEIQKLVDDSKKPPTLEEFSQWPKQRQNKLIFEQLQVMTEALSRIERRVPEIVKEMLTREVTQLTKLSKDVTAVQTEMERLMTDFPLLRAMFNNATRTG